MSLKHGCGGQGSLADRGKAGASDKSQEAGWQDNDAQLTVEERAGSSEAPVVFSEPFIMIPTEVQVEKRHLFHRLSRPPSNVCQPSLPSRKLQYPSGKECGPPETAITAIGGCCKEPQN